MATTNELTLRPGTPEDRDVDDDPVFATLAMALPKRGAGLESLDDVFGPFDLRVKRPRAIDLRKLWARTNTPEPADIAADIGARIPILLEHVITPFPRDGKAPGRVWAMGYDFIPDDSVDADTVSVQPSDEVLKIGEIGQEIEVGLDVGGKFAVPDAVLQTIATVTASMSQAKLAAVTHQKLQFSLKMPITLRKVVGAGHGKGGAQWKMYRQDEAIDRPHTLLQTLLVAPGTKSIPCTIKTWAKQAGYFGTRLGAKFWPYDDQKFEISLEGLASP